MQPSRSGFLSIGFAISLPILIGIVAGPTTGHSAEPAARPVLAPSPQQKRIAEFIEVASKPQSLQETIDALDESGTDAMSMILSSALLETSDGDSRVHFNAILADRRVARLFTELGRLPPTVAATQCRNMYDSKLALLGHEWKRVSSVFAEATTPVISLDLRRRYHALAAAVFLCGFYCDRDVSATLISHWRSEMQQSLAQSNFDAEAYTAKSGIRLEDVFPDELFELNFYALLVHVGEGTKLHVVWQDSKFRLPSYRMKEWKKWDSLPQTSLLGREEASNDKLRDIPLISGWHGTPPGQARHRAVATLKSYATCRE